MKTLIFLTIVIVLWASSLYAQPYYLTCDPQSGVSEYILIENGSEHLTRYPAISDGSAQILLQGYTPGMPYVFELIAVDQSGWGGDISDPLNARKPGKSSNVRISE